MTWQDRVSFVLDSSMCLKRIELLDVVLEAAGSDSAQDSGEDGFDADVAIITAELGRLIPDLIEALGGERAAGSEAGQPAPGGSGTVAANEAAQAA